MQYIGTCPNCGGELKSISIGWKCDKCGGLVDMQGNFHEPVNEAFLSDDVPKEQDEAAGGKYRRAIERMGGFGKLFVEYSGDPRGPMGRAGGMSIAEEAQIMPVITDIDGGKWRPVQEEVLQDLLKQLDYWKEQNFRACYEKGELSKRAENATKTIEAIIGFQKLCVLCGNMDCKTYKKRYTECRPVWDCEVETDGF